MIKLNKIENVEPIEITENVKMLSKIKSLNEMLKTANENKIELINKSTTSFGFGLSSSKCLFGTCGTSVGIFGSPPTFKAYGRKKRRNTTTKNTKICPL